MAVYKRRNIFWIELFFPSENGKKIKKQFSSGKKTRTEAMHVQSLIRDSFNDNLSKNKIKEILNYIYKDEKDENIQEDISFAEVWEIYEKSVVRKKIGNETIKNKKASFFNFAEFCKKNMFENFLKIPRKMAIDFIDNLANTKLKGKTVNLIRANLISVINEVMLRLDVHENIFKFTQMSDTSESITGRCFSDIEIAIILKKCVAISQEAYGLAIVLIFTGLRLGDALKLTINNIKDDVLEIIPGKTSKNKIFVKIPIHRKINEWILKNNPTDLFFPKLQKAKNNYKFQLLTEKIFADFKNKNYKIGWHCFRHTFRSKLSEAGADIEVAKKLLGHSSDTMSMRYNHDLSKIKNVIDKLFLN